MLTNFFDACFSDFYHGLYYCILLIAAFLSIACFKRANKVFKWVCGLIVLTFLSEICALYVGLSYGFNGIVYDIFTPIEYFIYANIYSLFLSGKKWKKVLTLTVVFFFLLAIINIIFFQPVTKVPTNLMNLEMIMLVFLSLVLFINIMRKPVYENIIAEGIFWFNSAVLFYYAFNILIWAFFQVLFNEPDPPKINSNMLLFSSSLLYAIYIFSVLLNYISANKLPRKNVATFAAG